MACHAVHTFIPLTCRSYRAQDEELTTNTSLLMNSFPSIANGQFNPCQILGLSPRGSSVFTTESLTAVRYRSKQTFVKGIDQAWNV